MKKIILIMMFALVPMFIIAQDNDDVRDSVRSNTKYGELFLQKGNYIKYEDYKVEKYPYQLNNGFGKIKASIRKLYVNNKSHYFVKLRIGSNMVYIEYSDLIEINKAIVKLQSEALNDCLKMPEYLENKFVTDDDFVIGYWVKKKLGKYLPTWYIDFDYLNNVAGSIYYDIDIDKISKMFQEKQTQIEEMLTLDK